MIVHWIVDGVSRSADGEWRSSLASNRYRAIIPARALQSQGHQVDLIDMASWHPRSGDTKPDVVVIGKLLGGPRYESCRAQVMQGLETQRMQGVHTLCDVNDDHFDSPETGAYWRQLVGAVDAVVASSDAMAQTVRRYTDQPVFVVGDPVASPFGEAHVYRRPAGVQKLLLGLLKRYGFGPQRLRLVWFGNLVNWPALRAWIKPLAGIASRQPWTLTLISSPGGGLESYVAGFNAGSDGRALLAFARWDESSVWEQVGDAHIVLLPSDPDDPKKQVKSANRLTDALNRGCLVVGNRLPAYAPFEDCAWLGDNLVEGVEWAVSHPDEALARIRNGQQRVADQQDSGASSEGWLKAMRGAVANTASAAAKQPLALPSAARPAIRLNLGCGDKILPGYINVDVAASRAGKTPDVLCDLSKNLCFADDSVEEVLAVHIVEHFWRWEVEATLKAWARVLAPGGRMVIECPNLISACKQVLHDPVSATRPDQAGRMSMWVLYGDPAWKDPLMCHRWAYTPESLGELMQKAGLVNVCQEPARFKMREPRDMRVVGYKSK